MQKRLLAKAWERTALCRKRAGMSQEEAARQLVMSCRAQASIPEKTAESVGERAGDAYSDPERVAQPPKSNNSAANNRVLSVGREVTEQFPRRIFELKDGSLP